MISIKNARLMDPPLPPKKTTYEIISILQSHAKKDLYKERNFVYLVTFAGCT